jgi:hypothetical protein
VSGSNLQVKVQLQPYKLSLKSPYTLSLTDSPCPV